MTIKEVTKEQLKGLQNRVLPEHQFNAANLQKTLTVVVENQKKTYLEARHLIQLPEQYHLAAPHVNLRTQQLDLFFAGEADATGAIRVVITNGNKIFNQKFEMGNYTLLYAYDSKKVILNYAGRLILIAFSNVSECENFVALFRSGLPSTVSRAPLDRADTYLRLTLRFE